MSEMYRVSFGIPGGHYVCGRYATRAEAEQAGLRYVEAFTGAIVTITVEAPPA